MSRMEVSPRPAPLSSDAAYGSHRHIPILPSSNNAASTTASTTAQQEPEVMEITPPSSAKMPPPKTASPEDDQDASPKSTESSLRKENGKGEGQASANGSQGGTMNAGVAAQTQGPKVVQTAFIHKLYSMLEDDIISHLISWSASGDSFVMAPSPDFSKVLAQYFKHTNISSFVRQLNMYGFHKVSDVFHTGNQDGQTMWEFRHGNNNFKRGDTSSLREIKRRASRHALIQRDNFPPAPHKPSVSQPGTPAEPVGDETQRLASLEYSMHDLHNRLVRAEEGNHHLSSRCSWLSESLALHQRWNTELASFVTRLTQGRDEPLSRDAMALHREVTSAPPDPFEQHRPAYPSHDPISPRQAVPDDRRGSLQHSPYRPNFPRPPVPQHLALSPRRYGSISTVPSGYPPSSGPYSPTTPTAHRPSIPGPQFTHPGLPAPHAPHPLSSVAEPGQSPTPGNLARRHTSADIRANEGWQQAQHQIPGQGNVPPLPPPGVQWGPPNPPPPHAEEAQQIRSSLESYQFGAPSRRGTIRSRPGSPSASDRDMPQPPPISGPFAGHNESGGGGWTGFGTAERPKGHAQRFAGHGSAPPTRRSSMASGLQSLLNPADTVERDEEDQGPEERKRKRIA